MSNENGDGPPERPTTEQIRETADSLADAAEVLRQLEAHITEEIEKNKSNPAEVQRLRKRLAEVTGRRENAEKVFEDFLKKYKGSMD